MQFTNRVLAPVLLLVSLLIAACGGGGGGSENGAGGNSDSTAPAAPSQSPTSPTGTTTPPAPVASRYFVYAGHTSRDVSAYTFTAASGELTANGAPVFAASSFVDDVIVDPRGKHAYVATFGVVTYSIDPASGDLTQVGVVGDVGAYRTTSVAMDPRGKFVYATSNDNFDGLDRDYVRQPSLISTYRIDPSSGALTQADTVVMGTSVMSIVVPSAGNVAYVWAGGNIAAYSIDPASGSLTFVAQAPAIGGALLAAHPGGTYVYAVSNGTNEVAAYRFDAAAGMLSQVGPPAASGTSPFAVAVHPSGKFAYVTNHESNNISVYHIDADTGALTPDLPAAVPGRPGSLAIDPDGSFAFVGVATTPGYRIEAYQIDPATGALTLASHPAQTVEKYPLSIAVVAGAE